MAAAFDDAGRNRGNLRAPFLCLWGVLQLAKLLLAWRLPLLVDEAFYAWEARHPDWAYSDLPGLTAALARLGLALGGHSALALRLPFLLLGAALPWLVVRIAMRAFGEEIAWRAGLLALLMPLAGLLGVLALPDVPLVLAAMLCLDAIASLRARVAWPALLELGLALALGALAHYRFAAVVVAGLAGVLLDARARALLREPRLWLVLAFGALAWWPLLQWNLQHAGSGLRFQLVDRNPWSFHADGIGWLALQAALLTPPLFVLLLATLRRAWASRRDADAPWGLLAGVGGVAVLGWFALGFFADRERVSFHWPLAGWLALATAAPVLLARWPRPARLLAWGCAALALVATIGLLGLACSAPARDALATSRLYPHDFAGWPEAARWLRARVPGGEPIVASDFELGARLAFALDRDDIGVLDDPLNHKHGRAQQLRSWGRQVDAAPATPVWFAVDDTATPMRGRLVAYHRRCEVFGALPPPQVLDVDHGRKRYLLYRYDPRGARAGCVAPALAYFDVPRAGARVPRRFEVAGWAFKDGAGIARVQVLLDGRVVADARYGFAMPQVADYWRISTDPAQPNVGFRARIDAGAAAKGRHWLGLRLHGRDGGVEDWPGQAIEMR
jgi:hypothetical protein